MNSWNFYRVIYYIPQHAASSNIYRLVLSLVSSDIVLHSNNINIQIFTNINISKTGLINIRIKCKKNAQNIRGYLAMLKIAIIYIKLLKKASKETWISRNKREVRYFEKSKCSKGRKFQTHKI